MALEDQSSAELSKGLRLLKHTCLLADTLLSSLIDLVPSWISSYIRWCPTSAEHLEEAERKLLSYVKLPYRSMFVTVDSILGCKGSHQIRTLQLGPSNKSAAADEDRVPLVLVHGFGSGVALWLLNLDHLAQDRTTYCFDLFGFGRSSRPRLSRDPLEAEYQFVQSIEEWRAQVGLDRFVLLGHSMGGFLAASYALRFPERVAHLVLADPWGFPERSVPRSALQLPSWVRVVATLLSPFNPLAAVRIAGPWGPRLVEKIRPDIGRKYGHIVNDDQAVPQYIYHCNAQTPSGESAFKAMMTQYGWARHPMINRIGELHQGVPMTFIYGSRSEDGKLLTRLAYIAAVVLEDCKELRDEYVDLLLWSDSEGSLDGFSSSRKDKDCKETVSRNQFWSWIDKQPGIRVQRLRPESEVDVEIIDGAGHHIFADKPEQFNEIVTKICRGADAAEKTIRSLAEAKEREEREQREMMAQLAH